MTWPPKQKAARGKLGGLEKTVSGGIGKSQDNLSTVSAQAPEQPEHRGDRRRFLIWALMLGAVPPERLTERVIAEIAEAQP